jgi:membrane protease subunit (stomatin/prohibitin family)
MSLGSFFRKQFIDVIQWTESDTGTLMARYPMQDMEIQYGAKLTVRESQMALFVNEGQAADAFAPGLYTLETKNVPILTNLMNWDKAFESPFKSDVYFFATRLQTGQKWGTQQPITIRDKDFGAVRLRGFGTYSWRLANPVVFHKSVAGTRESYRVEELEPQLRAAIIGAFTTAFAKSQVPFLDMAANQFELGKQIAAQLAPSFESLGLALDSFIVENLSLPDELQKRLDERISMNMVGNMQEYTQFQVAQSIPIAAANQGGGAAGLGAGLAAGLGIGKAMTDAMTGAGMGAPPAPQPPAAPAAPAAPPVPPVDPTKPTP